AWGQIFQSPAVVFALALVLLLLALNLFGVFSLPLIDIRAGKAKNADLRAFAEGFGATLLATPCGGPLLGGVLSWALLQPLGVLALTLLCVGLGMAFPYLLLAAFPALANRLPRPGEWMRTMEQALGFLLLGTVAYLVSLLPLAILPRVVASLVLAAFGGWLWRKRAFARLAGIACILAACAWPFMAQPAAGRWVAYTHAAFEDVLGKRPILVDFTADWCPTCKVVETTALRESALRDWEKQYGLALFRVDMTRENPEGEALLKAVGSVSIPVIAVFGTGGDPLAPLVLRDVVTKGQVEAALERVAGG
ncbi:MAG: thioredoxin family protein, partial [Deltaproteobacteria bacterium]|nr:thioredoxin family protein [Deltaproteobacteria bacterium]